MRGVGPLCCLLLALSAGTACDRNIEPFDPDEEPRQPDLSKIFPEGAERAEPVPPSLPPPPGEDRGAPPLPVEQAAVDDPAAAIRGRIELSPELSEAVPRGAILFIIARRAAGGPPLAVKRVPEPRFPLPFRIGPADRMIQQMPFEGPITLSARLDADGNATSRDPGDLQGTASGPPVDPGATGVVIVLDEKL